MEPRFAYLGEYFGDDYGGSFDRLKTRVYATIEDAVESNAWFIRPMQLLGEGRLATGEEYRQEKFKIEDARYAAEAKRRRAV